MRPDPYAVTPMPNAIQIDGQTLGTAKGAGKRNVWVAEVSPGQYVGMSV